MMRWDGSTSCTVCCVFFLSSRSSISVWLSFLTLRSDRSYVSLVSRRVSFPYMLPLAVMLAVCFAIKRRRRFSARRLSSPSLPSLGTHSPLWWRKKRKKSGFPRRNWRTMDAFAAHASLAFDVSCLLPKKKMDDAVATGDVVPVILVAADERRDRFHYCWLLWLLHCEDWGATSWFRTLLQMMPLTEFG